MLHGHGFSFRACRGEVDDQKMKRGCIIWLLTKPSVAHRTFLSQKIISWHSSYYVGVIALYGIFREDRHCCTAFYRYCPVYNSSSKGDWLQNAKMKTDSHCYSVKNHCNTASDTMKPAGHIIESMPYLHVMSALLDREQRSVDDARVLLYCTVTILLFIYLYLTCNRRPDRAPPGPLGKKPA